MGLENEAVWSFDDPVPISNETDLLDYTSLYLSNGYYTPPVAMTRFEKSLRSNTHHGSGLSVKRDTLLSTLSTKSDILPRKQLKALIHDYLATGNAYILLTKNAFGKVVAMRHLPTLYMRVGEDQKHYYYLNGWVEYTKYPASMIIQLKQIDMRQEIYGIPEWFAAISSAALAESAVLFRRKYYKNGAHAGFLLYINNQAMTEEDDDKVRQNLKSMRGLGNFNNLYINARGTDKSEPKLIPVGQLEAKDEFLNIKKVSRDDILSAWRVPPQLMGIMPDNVGGFGDVKKAAEVFYYNEIVPLQDEFLEINTDSGVDVLSTKPYKLLQGET